MNNTFDFKRFGFVFRKDFSENGKRYLLLFLTMLGLMALLITYPTWDYYSYDRIRDNLYHNRSLLQILSFIFFASGTWFASTFSNPMNHKLKRLSYLISPSSNPEKFVVRWMITTIGFILAFFAALWIADLIRVTICSVVYPQVDIQFLDITKLVYLKENSNSGEYVVPKFIFIILLSIYFLLQSIFLLGSTFWEKASFIKTFTAGAAISGAYILICRWAIFSFYDNLNGYNNVLSSFDVSDKYTDTQAITFSAIIISAFTLTCWILAFFRMKESEIIKRL